jgi:hypothetical protein
VKSVDLLETETCISETLDQNDNNIDLDHDLDDMANFDYEQENLITDFDTESILSIHEVKNSGMSVRPQISDLGMSTQISDLGMSTQISDLGTTVRTQVSQISDLGTANDESITLY